MSSVHGYVLDRTAKGPALGGWGFASRLVRSAARGLDVLREWQERASQRRQLASLEDRLLEDLALSRADVAYEIVNHDARNSPISRPDSSWSSGLSRAGRMLSFSRYAADLPGFSVSRRSLV